jgi:hypothetical protein
MQVLDQWLHYVDTQEVLPLFEKKAEAYRIPNVHDIDWSEFSPAAVRLIRDGRLSFLKEIHDADEVLKVLRTLNHIGEKVKMRSIITELLDEAAIDGLQINRVSFSQALLSLLPEAPFLTDPFFQSPTYHQSRAELQDSVTDMIPHLLRELVLLINTLGAFVKQPLMLALRECKYMTLSELAQLVELIALAVEEPEFALDLLLECIQPELSRLLEGPDDLNQMYLRSLMGIALDHIDEADEAHGFAKELLTLQPDGSNEGYEVVKATLRIDSVGAPPKVGDHVRLVVASPPENSPGSRPYSMDSIVIASQQGSVGFRCFHRPPTYLTECNWRYRSCGSFVTSKAMFDAVSAFYASKSLCCAIYPQIAQPYQDEAGSGLGALPTSPSSTLNRSQNSALDAAMYHSLTLLWGPPGTGKTYTIVTILTEMLRAFDEARFLVTAPTHNTVDNILRRYVQNASNRGIAVEPLRVSTDVSRCPSFVRRDWIANGQ